MWSAASVCDVLLEGKAESTVQIGFHKALNSEEEGQDTPGGTS